MATYTTSLNLKKPATSDAVNIADFNNNFDLIDAAVAGSWIPLPAMTRESDNTFSCAVDLSGILQKGYALRYKQGGAWKYQYIIAVGAYSGGKTIVTTTGGSDFIFAAGAITDGYYSPSNMAFGFPQLFNHAPAFTGFSTNPSSISYKFHITGNVCTVTWQFFNSGVSNATTFTVSLPVAPVVNRMGFCRAVDNSTNQSTLGMIIVSSGNSAASIYKDGTALGWTSTGNKNAAYGFVEYPI